jgi:hypothetical protein
MALTPLDAALQARLERFKRTLSRTLIIELGSLTR